MLKAFLLLFLLAIFCFGERIVTLGPAVTNQLLLIGSGDDIVGKTDYCPAEAGAENSAVSVGSLLSLSLETVISLKPTIVFASGLTPEPFKEKIRSIGLKLVVIDDPASYSALCENFRTIGKALQKSDVADSILNNCDSLYADAKKRVKGIKSRRVFFQLGTKPLYSVVKNSLGDELITLIGGTNVFTDAVSGEVSREAILIADPEVILISQMGKTAEKERNTWLSFPQLTAAKKSAVFLVDAYAVGSPTPVSFLETVTEFSKLIDSINEK